MLPTLSAIYLIGGIITAHKVAHDVRPSDGYDWFSVGLVATLWPVIFIAAVIQTIHRAVTQ